jgi:hypothetical protein
MKAAAKNEIISENERKRRITLATRWRSARIKSGAAKYRRENEIISS